MKKFNVCTCRAYQSQGVEKKFWPQVGTLTYFPAGQDKPEGYRLELNMFPNTPLYVFEQRDPADQTPRPAPKATSPGRPVAVATGQPKADDQIEYPTEDINPADIPF